MKKIYTQLLNICSIALKKNLSSFTFVHVFLLKKQRYFFSLCAGVMGGLALYNPQKYWFLIFFFLLPLFFALEKNKGFVFLLISFALPLFVIPSLWTISTLPLHWLSIWGAVTNTIIIGLLYVCFIITPIVLMVLWGRCVMSLPTNRFFLRSLLIAMLWILFEYARSWLFIIGIYGHEALVGSHHTYGTLGYTLTTVPFLKEMLPVGGIYLSSFAIVLINCLFYYSFFKIEWRTNTKAFFVFVLFVAFIVLTPFVVMKRVRSDPLDTQVDITLTNTNFPLERNFESGNPKGESAYIYLREHIDVLREIIVLPEDFNVLPFYHRDWQKQKKIHSTIIGSMIKKNSYSLYFLNSPPGGVEYSQKQLLVPLSEHGVWWFEVMTNYFGNQEQHAAYKKKFETIKRGDVTHIFEDPINKNLRIAGTMCSENISPSIFRNAVRDGATLLVNVASHARFYESDTLFRQTLAYNTARALETGRYIAVATNHNPSFVVSDTGTVATFFESRDTVSSTNTVVFLREYTTPYVRYGNIIVYIAFLMLLCALYLHTLHLYQKRFQHRA